MSKRLMKSLVCEQVAKKAEHLPHIWDLAVVEMVVRAAKHVLKVRLLYLFTILSNVKNIFHVVLVLCERDHDTLQEIARLLSV